MPLAAKLALERVKVLALCDVVRFGPVEVAECLGVVWASAYPTASVPFLPGHS